MVQLYDTAIPTASDVFHCRQLIAFCPVPSLKLGSDLSCIDKEGLTPLDIIQLDSPFQITSGGRVL